MKRRRAGCLGAIILMILLCSALVYIQVPRSYRGIELIRAIERHDSARALVLLQQGASPNTRQSMAHRTIWQALLEQVGLRSRSRTDPTALSMACGTLDTAPLSSEVIVEMVKTGADVGVKDAYGFSPLFNALHNKDDRAVLALIQAGADWRSLPSISQPPLELAIEHGNPALLEELLAHGADPNQRSELQETTLEQTLHYPGPEGEARMKILEELLAHGVDVNTAFREGHLPLAYAALRDELPEVGLLLAHGADINRADAQGNTALMVQIPNSHEKMTQFLLAHGAKVDPRNTAGQTALMIACAAWPAPTIIVPDLLKAGAEVNVQDRNGDTALIMACRWPSAEPMMVAQLLDHGANAALRNANGETALTCALSHSPDPETVRLLRQALTKSGKRLSH